MELFKSLNTLIPEGVTVTIVVKSTANGKMAVSTGFTTENGGICENLPPLMLKGTPEEIDNGFIGTLTPATRDVSELVSSYNQFQEAAKKAKDELAKKNTTSTSVEEQRKKKEEEEKRRKAKYDALTTEAEKQVTNSNYHTADALYAEATKLTTDKAQTAAISKHRQILEESKNGLLCSDN